MNIMKYDICPYLHAMSDFGYARNGEKTGPSGIYSRPHTNNAECYAEKCTRRGRCLIAKFYTRKELKETNAL